MSRVIWSAPDGSWGECDSMEMIVMNESDLYDSERDALWEARDSESEVRRIMESAAEIRETKRTVQVVVTCEVGGDATDESIRETVWDAVKVVNRWSSPDVLSVDILKDAVREERA